MKLTPREIEIIRLLASGWGSKQIGDQLNVSRHTVDTHRRNLLKKTGSKNTIELIANCAKMGLFGQ